MENDSHEGANEAKVLSPVSDIDMPIGVRWAVNSYVRFPVLIDLVITIVNGYWAIIFVYTLL